jgi:hypothetical protein
MVELQKAVYDSLIGDVSVGGQLVPIYDSVPQDKEFPFIVIGDDVAIDFDTDDSTGFEVTATIHSYSDHRGMIETKQMQSIIYSILHKSSIDVFGYNCVDSFCTYQTTIIETDGIVRHGVMRFNFILERV